MAMQQRFTKVENKSRKADELIPKLLEPVKSAKAIDMSQCPDFCARTGWRHPNGIGSGVVNCEHKPLVKRLENHS